ncbi:MAG: ATP synthase F0 subunit B [Bacillales bacterium]|jgi:F-type H+-transporting ATPase subunit b|nr:ATP synthase F0 subunit B [Bacillales bacterium]
MFFFLADNPLGDIGEKILPSWQDLIAQLIATGILFLVFYFFFWKKIKKMISKRKEHLNDHEAETLLELEKAQKASEIAEEKSKEIIKKAENKALKLSEENNALIKQALEDIQKRKSESLIALESSLDNSKQEFFKEMKEIILTINAKSGNKPLDDKILNETIETFLKNYNSYE